MADVTLRVLDGADRGRVYEHLPTPVTIGREEGNTVQLNDERISRFHIKIQEDQGKLVLTDLESTNGTRVNGEDVQLRILRFGDVIAVGRSVLLYGTREQIVGRLDELRDNGLEMTGELDPAKMSQHLRSRLGRFRSSLGRVRQSAQHAAHPRAAGVARRAQPRPGGAAFRDLRVSPPAKPHARAIGITLPEGATHVKIDLPQWQATARPASAAGRVSAQDRRAGGGISRLLSNRERIGKMIVSVAMVYLNTTEARSTQMTTLTDAFAVCLSCTLCPPWLILASQRRDSL